MLGDNCQQVKERIGRQVEGQVEEQHVGLRGQQSHRIQLTSDGDTNHGIGNNGIGNNQCGVCMEVLRLPYTFNCGHSLCITCTAEQIKIKKVCPFCRNLITCASPNYALRQILNDCVSDNMSEQELLLSHDIQIAFAPPLSLPVFGSNQIPSHGTNNIDGVNGTNLFSLNTIFDGNQDEYNFIRYFLTVLIMILSIIILGPLRSR